MERAYLLSILFVLATITSACSVDATIENIADGASELLQNKSKNNELVSASQQGVITSGKYRVQSSVSVFNTQAQVTTAQGYKVNTSVQSTLFKE